MFKLTLEPERHGEAMPEDLSPDDIMSLMQKVCQEVLKLLVERVKRNERHYVSMARIIGEWGYLCNIAGEMYTCFQDLQAVDERAWEECYEFDFLWNEGVASIALKVMEHFAEQEPFTPHKDLLLRSMVISHLRDSYE